MLEKREIPKEGECWRHYKGGVYHIIAVGRHSELTDNEMVVYKNVKGEVWIRPLIMFMEILSEGENEGRFRFWKVTEADWVLAIERHKKEEQRIKLIERHMESLKEKLTSAKSFDISYDPGFDLCTQTYTGQQTITIRINRG